MPLQFYTILHLVGALLLFLGLGATLFPGSRSSDDEAPGETPPRRLGMIFHGVGLLLLAIAGFGLIAKLGVGFPTWVWIKFAIFILLGILPVLGKRGILPSAALWLMAAILGAAAAYLCTMKPIW